MFIRKLLIAGIMTGIGTLTAGQYITTEVSGNNLHLDLTEHLNTNIIYYIDTDNNPNTGMTCDCSRIKGADLIISNGQYYDFTGNDAECDWDWEHSGGEWERGKHNIYIPLSTVAQASTIHVTAHAYNRNWKKRTYNFAKYGSDGQQMKTFNVDGNPLTIEHLVPSGKTAQQAANAVVAAVNSYKNPDNQDKKDWQVLRIEKVKTPNDGYNSDGHEGTEENYLGVEGHTFIMKLCNKRYADGLLENEADRPISMMMPCTITVYTRGGKVYIATMNAQSMMPLLSSFSSTATNLLGKTSQQMEEMVQKALSSLQ